jgi:hypothetical protein
MLASGALEVVTRWTWESPVDCAVQLCFHCTATYVFQPTGGIDVTFHADAPHQFPEVTPPLGRCGLRWSLTSPYDHRVRYFGLGPHEAYDDRLSCAYLGVFDPSIDDLHTPYTFPQECGRRANPRYIFFFIFIFLFFYLHVVIVPHFCL